MALRNNSVNYFGYPLLIIVYKENQLAKLKDTNEEYFHRYNLINSLTSRFDLENDLDRIVLLNEEQAFTMMGPDYAEMAMQIKLYGQSTVSNCNFVSTMFEIANREFTQIKSKVLTR